MEHTKHCAACATLDVFEEGWLNNISQPPATCAARPDTKLDAEDEKKIRINHDHSKDNAAY